MFLTTFVDGERGRFYQHFMINLHKSAMLLPDLQLLFQKKSIDQGVVLSGKAALRFGQRDGNRGLRRRPCFPFFFLNAGDRIRREVLPVLHQ